MYPEERAKQRDPDRIRKAWRRGYSHGRYWARETSKLDPHYVGWSPYTTYWPGVQCHVAWKIGFVTAFVLAGKEPARDWKPNLQIQGMAL